MHERGRHGAYIFVPGCIHQTVSSISRACIAHVNFAECTRRVMIRSLLGMHICTTANYRKHKQHNIAKDDEVPIVVAVGALDGTRSMKSAARRSLLHTHVCARVTAPTARATVKEKAQISVSLLGWLSAASNQTISVYLVMYIARDRAASHQECRSFLGSCCVCVSFKS